MSSADLFTPPAREWLVTFLTPFSCLAEVPA